jgi:hypothetical protein
MHYRPENRRPMPPGAAPTLPGWANLPWDTRRLLIFDPATPIWQITALTTDLSLEGSDCGRWNRPYGRCVYHC